MISFVLCMVQLSVGFCRGSRVEGRMSRVDGILSRVEGKVSRVECSFLIVFLSFGRKISRFFGRVKNIPCEFYNNFHVGTPCCSYKALE